MFVELEARWVDLGGRKRGSEKGDMCCLVSCVFFMMRFGRNLELRDSMYVCRPSFVVCSTVVGVLAYVEVKCTV